MQSAPRAIPTAIAALVALVSLGCAQLPQAPPLAVTRFDTPAPAVPAFEGEEAGLAAQGPGTVFPSIEAAAVDALTYAYLSAKTARTAERARGGSIYATRGGYSYDEIRVAGRLAPHRVSYTLKPGDVARFVIYPPDSDRRVNWRNERPSVVDRRGVTFKDPLHRPLYVLHPSLVIREYRGEGQDLTDVADLRRPSSSSGFLAGN
jgi:hypothetical protein